jgi:hypothetical protein
MAIDVANVDSATFVPPDGHGEGPPAMLDIEEVTLVGMLHRKSFVS